MSGKDKCFSVTWAIQNFSLLQKKELKSPSWNMVTDQVGGRNFELSARSQDEKVKFQLYEDNHYVLIMNYLCKMSLISSCGTIPLQSSQYGEYSIRRNAIFGDKRHLVLPHDTLTVYCQIWEERINTRELNFCSVLHRLNFPWNIENFDSYNGNSYKTSWKKDNLLLHTMIVRNITYDSTHTVTVWGESTRDGFYSLLDCKINHARGRVIGKGYYRNNFHQWKEEIAISERYNTDRNLELQFECIVAVNTDKSLPTSSSETVNIIIACLAASSSKSVKTTTACPTISSSESVKTTTAVSNPPGTLTNDLLLILRDTSFSDATLNAEGKSFSAHKVILAARSSVFKAMFEKKETTEGRSGVVDIEDVDCETIQRLLVFLYAESLEDLQWEEASKLYYAADKYSVLLLKQKCADILKAGLSVANACDALVLADRHSDVELMKCAFDYVRDHQEVISSSDWENLEESYPRLAAKILRQVFVKKGKN